MYTARVLKVIKRFACKPNYLVAQCSRNFSRNLKCETSTTSKFHQIRYLTTASNNLRKEEKSPQTYEVTFIKKNGDKIKVSGKEGDSLLDVVINNNLDFDGYGACEGTLTCSTCHVILKKEDYDKLPDGPTEEELDMLDLAFELTDTSRLGCQIVLSKDLDGLEVKLPSTINDARE